MIKEFKEFAVKGNMIDMAVGIIIGTAFGKIVTSLVSDVIMPPIGLLLNKVDFSNLYIDISGNGYTSLAQAQAAGAPTINYGIFLDSLINFLIISFVVFMLVTQINHLRKKVGLKDEVKTAKCPYCFSAISKKATRCPNCTSKIPPLKKPIKD